MNDPVRTVEKALADRWEREGLHTDSDPEVDAWTALQALVENGWRIVREGPCKAADLQQGLCECLHLTVTEEWKPDENEEGQNQ